MSKEDWAAAMSSEVFREYLSGELNKKAEKIVEPSEDEVLEAFEQFQNKVKATPKLLVAFKALQQKFDQDPVYRSRVNEKFAEAVMLLDLDDVKESQ